MAEHEYRTRKIISLGDPDYFCNRSWTLSFNMNTKSWISFHSYIPNWYIAENNFFYSGLNNCCDDFEFIAGESEYVLEGCRLEGYVLTQGCMLAGEVVRVDSTTTTTTTYCPFCTTTTTTTFVPDYPCELDGEVWIVDPTTTTTTTTICVRPERLDNYDIIAGYFNPLAVDTSATKEDACEGMDYLEDNPGTGVFGYTIEADSMNVGERVYLLSSYPSCECDVPDGWYFTDESAFYRNVFHIVNCMIVEIVNCDATTTTTSSTSSTTTTTTTIDPLCEIIGVIVIYTTTTTTTIPPTTTTTTSSSTSTTTSTSSTTTTTTTMNECGIVVETEVECVDPVEFCPEYGALYNWYAATDERKITSDDEWAVPTHNDTIVLADYVGEPLTSTDYSNANLVCISTGWITDIVLLNELNFNAKGAGYRNADDGTFRDILYYAGFIASTEYNIDGHYRMDIYELSDYGDPMFIFSIWNNLTKIPGMSIRFVRPATVSEQLLADGTSCTPYVGNNLISYSTVKIGTQVWLADNLAETKYRNGEWITGYDGGTYTPISNENWAALETEAMCFYDDDETNGGYLGQCTTTTTTTTEPTYTLIVNNGTIETTTTTSTSSTTTTTTTIIEVIAVMSGSIDNNLAYSSDAENWIGLGTSYFGEFNNGNDVTNNGSRWVAVGSGGTNTLWYSDNGIDWNSLGNTVFSAVGSCVRWNGSYWLAGGGSGKVVYSSNGTSWDVATSPFNDLVEAFAWSGSRWVGCGGLSSINNMAYSDNSNGNTWTGLGKPVFSSSANGVAFNGSKWVAVGTGSTNTIAHSDNGIDWTGLGKTIFSTVGINIVYANNMFLAFGGGTNTIAYSTNGVDWTGVGTSIFSTYGYSAAWTGDKWIAVGQGTNTLAESTNGIDWTGLGTSIFGDIGRAISIIEPTTTTTTTTP